MNTAEKKMLRPPLRRGLYLILTEPRDGYEKLCRWAVKTGLPAVQLRYKGHDEREHLALAHALRQITNGTGTLFIVNDRPDIALISRADGVHLGQDDLAAAEARQLIGSAMLLGLSTHNLEQVAAANTAPVDYIGFGPLFATNSKEQPDPVTGPDVLNAALTISRHPVVAIGGLDLERIRRLHPRPHNAAVIRAVSDAPDSLAAMRAIHAACLTMNL
jgi:thiamine-phosphate pyrophosphorylase